jgi:hypothetical protein
VDDSVEFDFPQFLEVNEGLRWPCPAHGAIVYTVEQQHLASFQTRHELTFFSFPTLQFDFIDVSQFRTTACGTRLT